MARPLKIGLDYFPLDVSIDDNVELLEAEEGLEGFAILVKIWQKIYSNGYFIEWNEDSSLLFCKKINADKTKVNSVINTCLRRNLFNKKIYDKYKILTSCGIQKRFITACYQSKRKSISVISEYILVNSEFTELITEFTQLNTELSTQSKVKESKVKESKVKESKVNVIPTLKEFGEFALLKKPNVDKLDVKLKYDSWVENGWKDGNNEKILNWKSKLLNTLPHIKESKEIIKPTQNNFSKKAL
jgi:Domain of unknown function (DUF4373)